MARKRDEAAEAAQRQREEAAEKARTEHGEAVAERRARDVALQGYLDRLSQLLMEHSLRNSQPSDDVSAVARAHTLTVLERLDETRKDTVLRFLYESDLIDKEQPIIALAGANLCDANLKGINLKGADLKGVNLSFRSADLSGADLTGARLTEAVLARVKSLEGATVPVARTKTDSQGTLAAGTPNDPA